MAVKEIYINAKKKKNLLAQNWKLIFKFENPYL